MYYNWHTLLLITGTYNVLIYRFLSIQVYCYPRHVKSSISHVPFLGNYVRRTIYEFKFYRISLSLCAICANEYIYKIRQHLNSYIVRRT